jgi:hypothetical protein
MGIQMINKNNYFEEGGGIIEALSHVVCKVNP